MITGISLTAFTSLVLQQAVVRRGMGLQPLPAHPPKLPSFLATRHYIYKSLSESQAKAYAEAEARKT
jgi:hypothetical protein